MEAAFQDVPSIGSAVGGIAYMIEDGKMGLLVPIGEAMTREYCKVLFGG